ncbi:RING finger protein 150 [Delphinapterus leucas]|uniref:RING finger protein 150 n=1 Tax=Delphinapterus leucas TaxID=9749 RepID=A0A2Y9P4A6_DELLE|nr:RING finger protein 150 [Delphinapterus leucas]
MIPEPKGKEIVSLLERNITVTMYITIGTRNLQKYVSRTSVVFVSISFIVLMIISLAWLVFYYIQRFRYANARDRNQRRLGDAAKKAISKLQVRTIKKGDKETEPDFDNCAVCIEGYKPNDVVRILPCRHLFHKSCVDPWLLDHRTCPMCKMNILKALGIPPNADCMDDLPTDFEGSLGGPSTNQITGASDTTVNESSVTLDAAVRTVGALQVVQDTDPTPQEGGIIFTTNKKNADGERSIVGIRYCNKSQITHWRLDLTFFYLILSYLTSLQIQEIARKRRSNSEQEPAISSDSDISLIMAMEVGLSDVELSTDQDCEEVKS